MLSLRKISSLTRTLQKPMFAAFGYDNWKDREGASEKVFVSQQESIYSLRKDNQSKNC